MKDKLLLTNNPNINRNYFMGVQDRFRGVVPELRGCNIFLCCPPITVQGQEGIIILWELS